ncbi:hypothetical protein TanjilG_07931 [Lupinus angustifolius]|uniref:Uncharacterized protein n=1 Tax=Lupinus angustifolius TaxID=3871 RepID=A0A4P1RL77_LUPAN|nr:PREDICTED: uncharacterized protein LOC109345717 [Lupinus angustifolius]OIW13589.1 hypothetical protein TanjilG_07931 [Lupinus angustifolius]
MSGEEQQRPNVESTTIPSSSSSSSIEELQHMPLTLTELKKRRRLTKQLSMTSMCETPQDIAWERRRRQIQKQERGRRNSIHDCGGHLTDEDLNELKGCIELGFGFNEEDGQTLCNTLPALDLYFAVNRQLSPSPVSTPHSLGGRTSSFGSPRSGDSDSWKILSPGDDPEHVKTKIRHWAQAVACCVMQSH